MAYFMLKEPIFKLEILAMIICFAMVGTIASQSLKEEKAIDEITITEEDSDAEVEKKAQYGS